MTGKMERYTQMRVNPTKSIGYSTAEAAEKITTPILFVVAENEELGSNANTERAAAAIGERGVPARYHLIKGISHYGVYREGFQEATDLELAWFKEHLMGVAAKPMTTPSETKPAPQSKSSTKAAANIEDGLQSLDADKNGKLNTGEFSAIKQSSPYFREHPDHLEPTFKRLDSDGALTIEEFRNIARPRQSNGGKAGAKRPAAPETKASKASADDGAPASVFIGISQSFTS